MNDAFLEAVRDADWSSAYRLASVEGMSVFGNESPGDLINRLIDMDAPSRLTVRLVGLCVDNKIDVNQLSLLETCMREPSYKENAYVTFCELLKQGLDPNLHGNGGFTLLQIGLELNRAREVKKLLEFGADIHKKSLHWEESTSAAEDAVTSMNEASRIILNESAR